ncbi:MAG: carboxy terminal-processing peptidase [Verrucomicrobiota bacterium]|nr:carboxy terminal-processing peptidase [Verrucomicrobiota bacterium]
MRLLSSIIFLKLGCALLFADVGRNSSPPTDPTEANIAKLVGRILERSHYSQRRFDDEVSSQFLDRYLETLDGQHLHFLQSDLKEFETYRTTLDDRTLKTGDTSPAHIIFARLLQRIGERVNYATNLLHSEKFEFTGEDRYTFNRKEIPRPKDLNEAKKLWRQHLRFEYLQEKLSAVDAGGIKAKHVSLKDDLQKIEKIEVHEKNNPSVIITNSPSAKKALKQQKGSAEEIIKTLTRRYNQVQRNFKELTGNEVFEIYLTALAHVYDPHSDYMSHEQLENFAISMKLSLLGIGALLESEDGYVRIKDLISGGPAAQSKQLKIKDRIVAVAQTNKEPVDVVDMPLKKVVEQIRGPKGTEVRLTIIPVDAADPSVRKTITLIRDEIKLEDQEAKAKVIEIPADKNQPLRLGVIDLPSFYEDFQLEGKKGEHKSTTADVSKLIKKLNQEKVSGIILDLRRNGGGALSEAINLTGLFIKKGPVVQTKDPSGEIIVDKDTDESVLYDGPLIILTSRFSASASEILAGALQDYGRALIVGDSSTHGKGTVQSLAQLEPIMKDNKLAYAFNPGALKITIRKFYRASGSSTQLKGVIPDLILPSINNYAEVGEASLENPLPWDEVSPAKYEKLNRVAPFLAELKKRSTHRVATEKDFAYVRDDIERFKKTLADKSFSLNEHQRLKETKELKAVAEARKKERQARKEPASKVFEVTLKNLALPGLQTPAPKTNEVALAESRLPDDEDFPEDKTPAVDVTLEEAKHILTDYISLAPAENRGLSLVK